MDLIFITSKKVGQGLKPISTNNKQTIKAKGLKPISNRKEDHVKKYMVQGLKNITMNLIFLNNI